MKQLSAFLIAIVLLLSKTSLVRCQESDGSHPIRHDQDSVKAREVSNREVWRHRLGYRKPIHSANSKGFGYLGGVGLELIIGTDGSVISAKTTDGPKEFYSDAIARSQTWKYKPFLRWGRPIVVQIQDRISILPPERLPSAHIPFPKVGDWSTLVITLERTGCYGTCPSYKVEIRGDGTFLYTGKSFVAVSGERRGQISQSSVLQLVETFRSADYFSLEDKYIAGVTDNPTYITSIAFDTLHKSVVDYVGEYEGMPDAVRELEETIDQIVGSEKWIHRE